MVSIKIQSKNSKLTINKITAQSIQQRRPVATVRPFLLRRGTATNPTGGSFKRRSLKLRRNTKDSKDIEADCEYDLLIWLIVNIKSDTF